MLEVWNMELWGGTEGKQSVQHIGSDLKDEEVEGDGVEVEGVPTEGTALEKAQSGKRALRAPVMPVEFLV